MRKGFMRRFLTNRMWTLVFALLLGIAGAFVTTGTAFADTAYGGDSGDGTGDALPVDPPPIGAGDPDSPANGGKPTARQGAGGGQSGVYGGHGVGDASAYRQAAILARIQVMVRALKIYYLRF